MKNKYSFQVGERREFPKCPCPLEDKSNCFKEFAILPEHKDRFGNVYREESYWKVICPYHKKISESAARGANEMLSKFFSKI